MPLLRECWATAITRGAAVRTCLLLAAAASVGLFGCATQPLPSARVVEIERPADFPEQVYRQAAGQGHRVLRIDPTRSIVVVEVLRGGSLARLGHDHVVASHDVRGYVDPDAGRADLYVPLELLVVDEPQLRAEAGFDTRPSADDIAGTRRNMRERVLDVGRFPFALVGVRTADPGSGTRMADVTITLHGVTRTTRVPVRIDAGGAFMEVSGEFPLDQTDFGITPLSILGGAVTVQDTVRLKVRIRATRQDPGEGGGAAGFEFVRVQSQRTASGLRLQT